MHRNNSWAGGAIAERPSRSNAFACFSVSSFVGCGVVSDCRRAWHRVHSETRTCSVRISGTGTKGIDCGAWFCPWVTSYKFTRYWIGVIARHTVICHLCVNCKTVKVNRLWHVRVPLAHGILIVTPRASSTNKSLICAVFPCIIESIIY